MRQCNMALSSVLVFLLSLNPTWALSSQHEIDQLLQSAETSLVQNQQSVQDLDLDLKSISNELDAKGQIESLKKQQNTLAGKLNRQLLTAWIHNVLESVTATEIERRDNVSGSSTTSNSAQNIVSERITMEDVRRVLNATDVIQESDQRLETWIVGLLQDYASELLESIDAAAVSDSHTVVESSSSESTCLTTTQTVQHIHTAIQEWSHDNDLARDGSIVYELTSPTYEPQSSLGQLDFVRRYMPQDWEEWLLPTNWESVIMPARDHFAHTFGLSSSVSTSCAPPESVLQPSNYPGSCWPVSTAESPASLTIRLPQVAVMHSISIDHASALLVSDRSSAPKTAKVYGYAPCSDDEKECQGRGFDLESKTHVADVSYDLKASTIQSFSVQVAPSPQQSSDDGSCSAVRQTCGGESVGSDSMTVAAISIEIVENWGNPHYTCLYRVRVQGDYL